MKYEDIEMAFEYANMGGFGENSAIINAETGDIYYTSELGGTDPLPGDMDTHVEKYICLPYRNELDLGKYLAMEFAYEFMPDEADTIERIFDCRGAFRRFKDFLEERGMLEGWYDFEHVHTKTALLEWCSENGLEVVDQ
jgi:hypothetical protein